MPAAIHALTPTLAVQDPRGLALREVAYCRALASEPAERRVRGNRHDAVGHCVEQRDPRLWALHEQDGTTPANLRQRYSLSGRELSRDSVDAGFACNLFGEAGQGVWFEDGKGNRRQREYDALLRPLAVHEQQACTERYSYADATPEHALVNACGRLLRHDDTAGSRAFEGYALGGGVSREARRFCLVADSPDWPVPIDEREALLEPEAAISRWRHGPLGEVLEQTDAAGHRQVFALTVAGTLREIRIRLGQGAEQRLLDSARYNAWGRMEEERLGNGVVIQRTYREEDGRLLRLHARRADGEMLQDLHYGYDPVGNVVSLEDLAIPVRHFANQRIEPRCEYAYDSLYQLREASGWEAGAASRGPGSLLDPGAVGNYRQRYRYDAAGNLLELTHIGAQAHGRTLVAERHSNRCLAQGEDFAGGFDANGNLLRLHPGVALSWNPRNELREVRPVTRESGVDDWERYLYDAAGQRARKLGSAEAARRTHTREVRYLPGLERHRNSREQFDVMLIQAGTCSVRVLHWHTGLPDEVAQDQLRYALADHLGSSSLELDADAVLISHEVFHPFGSTAWWAARNEIEAGYKTVRYSGKERDATGLYYYGARYYRTDWQRWLNPDPAGEADGLNLYCMVANAPVNRRDADGLQGFDVMDDVEQDMVNTGDKILVSGLDNFTPELRGKFRNAASEGFRWAQAVQKGLDGRHRGRTFEAAMRSTFGAESLGDGAAQECLKMDLWRTMGQVGRYLKALGKNEGWRLVLAELNDPDELAATLTSHVEGRGGRIAMGTRIAGAEPIDLAAILFHEALHAMNRDHQHVPNENDVLDYWDDFPKLGSTGTPAQRAVAVHERLAYRARKGPRESRMPGSMKPWYRRLVNTGAHELGLPKPRGLRQRKEYFRKHPAIRYKVMLHNANTLSDFASAFHKARRQ